MRHVKLTGLKLFLKWYVSTFLSSCVLIFVFITFQGVPPLQLLKMGPQILTALVRTPIFLLLQLIPYMVFLFARHLFRVYKTHGPTGFIKSVFVKVLLPVFTVVFGFGLLRHNRTNENFKYAWDFSIENHSGHARNLYALDHKQRGIHFFSGQKVEVEDLLPLVQNNIEWVVLVPFGWQDDANSSKLSTSFADGVVWSEKDSGIVQTIRIAKRLGIRSMLKPHVWLRNSGKWRSDIQMDSDTEWQEWFDNYRSFILHYAEIAERSSADLLCIGTELHGTVVSKPEIWRNLITEIKKIYHGKLTYAANWNKEVEEVVFWDQLDFIGIQAYYPLVGGKNPTVKDLVEGWRPHFRAIQKLSKRYHKRVLFTEIGYKSTADAAISPWIWPGLISGVFKKVSTKTQANAYEAFFRVFWKEDWFAGVHVWKWDVPHKSAGGRHHIGFTPQNKPAQNILAKWFGKAPSVETTAIEPSQHTAK